LTVASFSSTDLTKEVLLIFPLLVIWRSRYFHQRICRANFG